MLENNFTKIVIFYSLFFITQLCFFLVLCKFCLRKYLGKCNYKNYNKKSLEKELWHLVGRGWGLDELNIGLIKLFETNLNILAFAGTKNTKFGNS